MSNLSNLAVAHDLSARCNLSDRTRFGNPDGRWASLCYPNPRVADYRAIMHDHRGGKVALQFPAMSDALDAIARFVA